ncbi:MAG: hypothetical protein ABI885_11820 [Gammaproteobacteria bacterium]
MTAMRIYVAALGWLAVCATPEAASQQIDYAIRTTAVSSAEGRRDLGLAGDKSQEHLLVNFAPRVLIELNQAWTGYVRARLFLPTGAVAAFDSDQPDDARPVRAFAGLNEFWLQYNGLTSYPGEAVRIGRQHIRQANNESWDQDAEAIRWFLDTTLLRAEAGVARQFSTYRTDSSRVRTAQRDRTYWFGNLAIDWRAQNQLGLRVTHAVDGVSLPQVAEPIDPDSKLQDAQLTWVSLYADNGFYEIRGAERRLSYGSEITYLRGHQVMALRGADDAVAQLLSQGVSAWQAHVGIRWRPLSKVPLRFGAALVHSQGGEAGGRSHQYQQTGMQSNASYFTGTQTLMGRYNETLRAQLGNLQVATGIVSFVGEQNDASLVFSRFRRDTGSSPIVTDNVTAAPVNDDRDIGDGLDLVLTHYFGRSDRRQHLLDRGDAFAARERRSLFSLRASMFRPGTAYGPMAQTDYRVLLELTLWLD